MPTPTYTPIATKTLTSAATSITFSDIPQTFRDLIVISSAQNGTGSSIGFRMRLNGDTGSNYISSTLFFGAASPSAFGATADHMFSNATGTGADRFNNFQLNVMDYSATDKHKSILKLSHYFGAVTFVETSAFRYTNTAAITSVSVFTSVTNGLKIGSSVSLYGIAG